MSLRDYTELTGLYTDSAADARKDVLGADDLRTLAPQGPAQDIKPLNTPERFAWSPTPLRIVPAPTQPLPANETTVITPSRGTAVLCTVQNNTAQTIYRGYAGGALLGIAAGQTVSEAVTCSELWLYVQTTGTVLNPGPAIDNAVIVEFGY